MILCPVTSYLGFRTATQISSMSNIDCQNTLIVELEKITSDSTNSLQQLKVYDLMSYSYLSNALWYYNVTSKGELASMSLEDQRNMVISLLNKYYPYTFNDISTIQAFSNIDLINNFISYQNGLNGDMAKLQSLFGDLTNAVQTKFTNKDSIGNSMDSIHILESNVNQGIYYGVYHTYNGVEFNVYLSKSNDLMNWNYIRMLLYNCDMPYIYRINGYDYILMVHEQWFNDKSSVPSRIGIKLYNNENDLVYGMYEYSYNISLTLGSITNIEGTPNIYSAYVNKYGCINAYIGFHYNDASGVDQNGFGILHNFGNCNNSNAVTSWITYDEDIFNSEMKNEYGVIGNIGQRDIFHYNDNTYCIIEGNIGTMPPTIWQDWKLWIWKNKDDNNAYDYKMAKEYGDIYPINVITANGSINFANPSIKIIKCPNNNQTCVFISYFIFSEGAGLNEAGSVIFYKYL